VIHGLRAWLGVKSVRSTFTPPVDVRPLTATFVAAGSVPIDIAGASDLKLGWPGAGE